MAPHNDAKTMTISRVETRVIARAISYCLLSATDVIEKRDHTVSICVSIAGAQLGPCLQSYGSVVESFI